MFYWLIQAEVLRLGGAEVKLSYVELFDDNIGPRGALALGIALSKGHNLSLLNLKLDFNPLGTPGLSLKFTHYLHFLLTH